MEIIENVLLIFVVIAVLCFGLAVLTMCAWNWGIASLVGLEGINLWQGLKLGFALMVFGFVTSLGFAMVRRAS